MRHYCKFTFTSTAREESLAFLRRGPRYLRSRIAGKRRTSALSLFLALMMGTGAVLILLSTPAFIFDCFTENERQRLEAGANVGWTRQQVMKHLGPPQRVFKSPEKMSSIAPEWYSKPFRAAEQRVMLYSGDFWKLYVYLDARNYVTYKLTSKT